MPRLILLSPFMVLGLSGLGHAQPLYLGEHDIDTADRGAMATLIERCSELAAEEGDAATVASFTREAPASTADQPGTAGEYEGAAAAAEQPAAADDENPAVDRDLLAIDLDGLASGGDDQASAGESAGEGAPPPEDSAEESGAALADVTLQSCKEAGLVY